MDNEDVESATLRTATGTEPAAARSAGRRGGGLLVGLLIMLLAAFELYHYLQWRQSDADTHAALADVGALDAEVQRLAGRPAGDDAGTEAALAALRQAAAVDREASAAARAELLAGLQTLAGTTTPSGQAWRLAECDHLLRLASHRLALARDVAGATRMLTLADEILRDLDDATLAPVRVAIASDLAALAAVSGPDIAGLHARLRALADRVELLPSPTSGFAAEAPPAATPTPQAPPAPAPPPASVSERIWQALSAVGERLTALVRVRADRTPGSAPVQAPEQAHHVRLIVRLHVEQAAVAMLRGESRLYADSLRSAQALIGQHFDARASSVVPVMAAIDDLAAVDVAPALPDVASSIAALHEQLPSLRSATALTGQVNVGAGEDVGAAAPVAGATAEPAVSRTSASAGGTTPDPASTVTAVPAETAPQTAAPALEQEPVPVPVATPGAQAPPSAVETTAEPAAAPAVEP